MERLLKAGADVTRVGFNFMFRDGVTPLTLVSSNGSVEVVKLLIQAGADVNKVPERGYFPLMEALYCSASVSQKVKCWQLLIEAGADVNMTTPYCGLALIDASVLGFDEDVELLIQAEADVNKFSESQELLDETALMAATSTGNLKITELLLKAGADVNLPNSDGNTALMWFSF